MPAFNVNNLEQIRAIVQAAEHCRAPVILQASAGARKYAGPAFIRSLVKAAVEEWPDIPVCLHRPWGFTCGVSAFYSAWVYLCYDGWFFRSGYEKTPADYDYNVHVTKTAVDMAHACGVSVEGELGCGFS